MKRKTLVLSVVCGALACGASAEPVATPAPQATTVLMRDIKVPGALVQWTRRTDTYTLQIVFKAPSPKLALNSVVLADQSGPRPLPSRDPSSREKLPATQAWLLRADGTVIPALRFSRSTRGLNAMTVEDTYAFARSATTEAVAMAVMIDGQYSVERLVPFADEKN